MNTPHDPALKPTYAPDPLSATPDTRASGVVPPNERNVDPARAGTMDSLTAGPARPLGREEREAAAKATTPGERVYAPASERVPIPPAPGHEQMVSRIDTNTAERRAASALGGASAQGGQSAGYRPGGGLYRDYAEPATHNGLLWGIVGGSAAAMTGMTIGGWLYAQRRKRERNRPINRARRALATVRQRLPETQDLADYVPRGDLARPASGVGAALLSIVLPLAIRSLSQRLTAKPSLAERARSQADDLVEMSRDGRRVRLEDLKRPGWVKLAFPSSEAVMAAPRKMADRATDRLPEIEVRREAGIGFAGAVGLAAAGYLAWRVLRSARGEGVSTGIDSATTHGYRGAAAAD